MAQQRPTMTDDMISTVAFMGFYFLFLMDNVVIWEMKQD